MKRCPECRRDYYDDSLMYCLEDGVTLIQGSVPSPDEPATAILNSPSTLSGLEDGDSRDRTPIRSAKWAIIATTLVLAVAASAYFGSVYLKAPKSDAHSLAVLPFANIGGNKDSEYLSDGIAETLINSFTKIPDLKVAARTTAFHFRGREDEPKQVGRELEVGAILTGSVLQQNNNVSIQVDLIDTASGSQLWGNKYDGKVNDLVSIQQKIAADVASRMKLSTAQAQQISRTYTRNADAYQHYLRGRYQWNKRTAEGLTNALSEFKLAIDNDPTYALAYAGLADCYLLEEEYAAVPNLEVLPKAITAAQQAIAIDDSLAEAHTSMASAYDAGWQWDEAQKEFERAIELDPNYPTAHHWYSYHLRDTGNFDKSLAEAKRAQELDPLSNVINSNLTNSFLVAGDLDAAERQAQRSLELDPNFANAVYMLALIRIAQGRQTDALPLLQKAVDLSDRSSYALGLLGYGYALVGKRSEALAIAKELEERNSQGKAIAQSTAMVLAGLGQKDAVFDELNKDYLTRSGLLAEIVWTQPFETMRSDPRFKALLERMNVKLEANK